VDPTSVAVEVQDGIAVLTGSVDSPLAKHAAQEAAHRVPGVLEEVPGVRGVTNSVHVGRTASCTGSPARRTRQGQAVREPGL
jgi:osmotically-inducible protein OsmY